MIYGKEFYNIRKLNFNKNYLCTKNLFFGHTIVYFIITIYAVILITSIMGFSMLTQIIHRFYAVVLMQ